MIQFPFTNEELEYPVRCVIDKVRPTLHLDGGDVEILKIEAPKIFVRLQGACKGCSSANLTLKNIIEKNLRTQIHPDLEVINMA